LKAQDEGDFIQGLMDGMSVEEKVGQLFLVTFAGSDLSLGSDVAELIREYRVGGVTLLSSNGNFAHGEDTPRQVAMLTNGLQALAFSQPLTGTTISVPLFIAITQEGDGLPYTQITAGVTAVPSNMALGATWNVKNAEKIGEIVGRELGAMGINMLLGPSLDVLDNPRPGLKGDLGTRVFGGDPYWVGKFGRAYIRGVHIGSDGKVAVVAKHFPGHGGSDRRADEEVATVQKSLQELRKIELAPFFAVTQLKEAPPSPPLTGGDGGGMADALMTSHIRYRGFQGNIRQLTRPISFDPQALQALMALSEFEPWRTGGGLMISDDLGVPAVRKYYDPQLQTFPQKRIAQEAFLAGNDLLMLSHFALTDHWPEQLENIKLTIQFFRDKYLSDRNFQARVDEALRRILRLKHRLYPDFALEAVLVDVENLAEVVGRGREDVFQIAQGAITLIYPGPEELADRLPSPPLVDEDILIFTEDRQASDCPDCEPAPFIEPDALRSTILRLYGPEAIGQVDPERIHSLTFSQLKQFLIEGAVPEVDVEGLVREADWLVFAMLDLNLEDYPQSDAVKSLLKLRPDVLPGKKVVVLAYNAPYYLDSTETSKLTAYYGIYSKVEPFIEASVRALFQEFMPVGISPVSVEGIKYSLISRTEPDPNQVIEVTAPDLLAKQEGTPAPIDLDVGDTLRVRTSVILDRNGHPVPDGTPAVFRLFYPAESVESPPHYVTTVNGVAETTIAVERTGELHITVTSDPAQTSNTLKVIIQGDEPATIATLVPTPTDTPVPTSTPMPTSTPTDTPTSTPTPTPTDTPTPTPTSTSTLTPEPIPTPSPTVTPSGEQGSKGAGEQEGEGTRRRVDVGDFLLAVLGSVAVGGASYLVQLNGGHSLSRRLRFFLWSVMGGLIGYSLYGLNLPGARLFRQLSQNWGALLMCLFFSLLPLGYVLGQQVAGRKLQGGKGAEGQGSRGAGEQD
jgi:beta-N-acetylhexosaminidase